MVLYRKYRPQTFAQVVGQDHIRGPLLAQLTSGKISHAYLFSGPRGTGKTSVARILAKAVNCLAYSLPTTGYSDEQLSSSPKAVDSKLVYGEPCNECESCVAVMQGTHLDLIEIDAASNRGIDEIRDLREKIKLSPASGRFKVYIIDEAHMLTPEAFNALLKTLEEPPEHAIFVLATTEPQKIPATIASRTSRFDFKVPNVPQIKEKLMMIAKGEGWKMPEESLEEIARRAAGAFRDGEVLLEKIASVDPAASLEKTREILGKKEAGELISLLELLEKGDIQQALFWLNDYLEAGGSVRVLSESMLETLREILLIKAGAASLLEPIGEEELAALESFAAKISKVRLLALTDLFNRAVEELREATIPQLPLELAIVEATLGKQGEEGKEGVEGVKDIGVKAEDAGEVRTANAETRNKTGKTENKKPAALPRRQEETETQKGNETQNFRASEPFRDSLVARETFGKGAAKAKTQKDENKLLKKLQKDWTEFLKKLKPLNSSIALFLKDAKPIELDEDLLTIEFGYRFHKEKVGERKYREVVEKALEGFTGTPLRIKGVVSEQPPAEKKKETISSKSEEEIDPAQIFGKLE